MLRLLSDENFHGDIFRGLLRQLPALDIVRVQDVGLAEAEDSVILEWAASQGRILVTHDRRTVPRLAYERVRLGQTMPGIFVVSPALSIGQAIDELALAAECLAAEECANLAKFFPL